MAPTVVSGGPNSRNSSHEPAPRSAAPMAKSEDNKRPLAAPPPARREIDARSRPLGRSKTTRKPEHRVPVAKPSGANIRGSGRSESTSGNRAKRPPMAPQPTAQVRPIAPRPRKRRVHSFMAPFLRPIAGDLPAGTRSQAEGGRREMVSFLGRQAS